MASMTELLMNLAAQQSKQIGQQQENQYAGIRNQFAPEGFRLQNELTAGQVKKIPAEIQQILAAAALSRANASAVPSEIELRKAQAATYNAELPFIEKKWRLKEIEDQIEQAKLAQRIKEMNAPQSTFGKAVQDYQNLNSSGTPNNELVQLFKTYLNTEANPKGGMSLTVDPKTGAVSFQSGGGGKTAPTSYTNPQTGQTFSVPTKQIQSRLQKSVIGNEMVVQGLDEIVKDIEPYLGRTGNIKKWWDENYAYNTNSSNDTLSKYNYAIDSATQKAENLLSANNLNVTDQSISDMKQVLKPREKDSSATYRKRIALHIRELKRKQAEEQRLLAQGIPVAGMGAGVSALPDSSAAAPAISLSNISIADIQAEKNRRREVK